MSSSEGEDFLDSADINEEFSIEAQENDFSCNDHDHDENDENDSEHSENEMKYAEELEYEDIGEPATFNLNIHNGTPSLK